MSALAKQYDYVKTDNPKVICIVNKEQPKRETNKKKEENLRFTHMS